MRADSKGLLCRGFLAVRGAPNTCLNVFPKLDPLQLAHYAWTSCNPSLL